MRRARTETGWRRFDLAQESGVQCVPSFGEAQSLAHILDCLSRVTRAGGEGLVARAPGVGYVAGKTRSMLKIKPEFVKDQRAIADSPILSRAPLLCLADPS